jgi:hypothetical protein
MALKGTYRVETTDDEPGDAGQGFISRGTYGTYDEANEAAVKVVADGHPKDRVHVVPVFEFDDSHEIEPTPKDA